MKYTYEITIEATNQQEAKEKLGAVAVLIQKLQSKELTRLAEVVKNDPIKTAIAKRAMGL